ncbi:MAG TPA: 2-octaprenyl-6-methoxyphenyl hydroxylase [Gammaproteobacteria bacterium]
MTGAPAARLDCDVLIVGGGLVGSALAAALADTPLRVVLVESADPAELEQPSFDARVTALANGSKRILDAIGLWRTLAVHAEPITEIHVSERGRFGAARIRAREEGVPALGYTIENRRLGEALWARLAAARRCTVLGRASLREFRHESGAVHAEIERSGERIESSTSVLVAADGARSRVRDALGIATREDAYAQQALILNCRTERAHGGVAYERFAASGPLAMLPLPGGRVGVVWTLPSERASEAAALPDDEFRAELQAAFGYRLGRIGQIGRRALHPLRRLRSDALGKDRVVLVGNAAVTLHPVAGQGFNLALRDVAALAELVVDAARTGAYDGLAARYAAWRAADQRNVALFTHGLVGLFGADVRGLGAVRGLGLAAFDLLPGAKRALARHTMGLAGRLPRLARGVPLAPIAGEP